jgi:hypothetical protein
MMQIAKQIYNYGYKIYLLVYIKQLKLTNYLFLIKQKNDFWLV